MTVRGRLRRRAGDDTCRTADLSERWTPSPIRSPGDARLAAPDRRGAATRIPALRRCPLADRGATPGRNRRIAHQAGRPPRRRERRDTQAHRRNAHVGGASALPRGGGLQARSAGRRGGLHRGLHRTNHWPPGFPPRGSRRAVGRRSAWARARSATRSPDGTTSQTIKWFTNVPHADAPEAGHFGAPTRGAGSRTLRPRSRTSSRSATRGSSESSSGPTPRCCGLRSSFKPRLPAAFSTARAAPSHGTKATPR